MQYNRIYIIVTFRRQSKHFFGYCVGIWPTIQYAIWRTTDQPLRCQHNTNTNTSQKSSRTTEHLHRCHRAPHSLLAEPLQTHRGTTEELDSQRCYDLMQQREPPENCWGTTQEPQRCWHRTHSRRLLRNQWRTAEILSSTTTSTTRRSLTKSAIGFFHLECFCRKIVNLWKRLFYYFFTRYKHKQTKSLLWQSVSKTLYYE